MRNLDMKSAITQAKMNSLKGKNELSSLDKASTVKGVKEGSYNTDILEGKATAPDLMGGGLAALSAAPQIYQTLSTKPTSGQEAMGQNLGMAATGAQIGTAIMPGIGTAVGAVVGFGASAIANSGWREDLLRKEDAEAEAKLSEEKAERERLFYENKNSGQIKAEQNLLKQTLGYQTT